MEALKPQGQNGQAGEGDGEKRPDGEDPDPPGEEECDGYQEA